MKLELYGCDACHELHEVTDGKAPDKCRACGHETLSVRFERELESESQDNQDGLNQMSMEDFQTLITNTVNQSLEGMTKVDRQHAMFPGQMDDKRFEGMSKEERVISFFRNVVSGDVFSARDIYARMENRTTMDETTDAQGAVLVPTEMVNEVWRIAETYGIARRDCRVVPMGSKTKNIDYLASGVTVYWPSEGSAITKGEPTFGQTTLTAKKCAALIANTEELFEDSAVDIYQLVAELTAEAIAEAEDNQLFQGSGSSPSIYGILTKTGVNAVTLDAGNTGFSNVQIDKIFDMPDAVTEGARKGGKYYTHYNILTYLRKKKDNDGNYILVRPIDGNPAQLCGFPYEVSEEMPSTSDSAADTAFMAFGNLKKCVAFGARKQLAVKFLDQATVGSENLGEEVKTALRFHERIDIAVVLATGLARLKTAAA